jgi:hypothetical protein
LAYAADHDRHGGPVQLNNPSPRDPVTRDPVTRDPAPRDPAPRDLAVEALRHLLTQAQISFWECPPFCSSTQDAETAISRATEACDNYLLVLSPAAVADDYCLQGLLFALSLNKRIMPLMAEPVALDHLPDPLQALEIIDLQWTQPPLSQTPQGHQIVATLHHEADYHQAHTQLLTRALQWERRQRDPALLLQGADLVWYQRWLGGARERSHHGPIYLQSLYVAESVRHGEQSSHHQSLAWFKRWLKQ